MRSLLSWNIRWLKDEKSKNVHAKKAALSSSLLAGAPVLLQETHWDPQAVEIWRNLFPACTVAAAPAIFHADGGGRPAGGIAIILPAEFALVDERILSPGRALLCVCKHRTSGEAFRLLSLHLPPDARAATLKAVIVGLPPSPLPTNRFY